MDEFRRFIISFLDGVLVFFLFAVAVGGGLIGAGFGALFGMGLVGFLVGAVVGFFLSAFLSGIYFLISEVAANTRKTEELLRNQLMLMKNDGNYFGNADTFRRFPSSVGSLSVNSVGRPDDAKKLDATLMQEWVPVPDNRRSEPFTNAHAELTRGSIEILKSANAAGYDVYVGDKNIIFKLGGSKSFAYSNADVSRFGKHLSSKGDQASSPKSSYPKD